MTIFYIINILIIVEIKDGDNMKITNKAVDEAKLAAAKIKAKRLCKINNCGLIDLIVLSMNIERKNKIAQNKTK